ncbi:MAG: DUF1552 domain-containing protein [Polyangiaceae bacterium]
MTIKPLNRRTVLRGLLATGAAVSIPLPLLEIMLNGNGTALAQTMTPLQPLYVTWFFGNGSIPALWKPATTGAGTQWQLSSQLQPLSTMKSYLTVVSGLTGNMVVGGKEHPTGSAGATTGAPLSGNGVTAASIDQIVADTISTGAPFRSLEVGVTPATPNGNDDSLHTVSHRGANARNDPEFDPKKVFSRLFTSGAQPPATGGTATDQAANLVAVRKSVLDSILQDGTNLQQKLGAVDKQRVEQHLEAIRAVELRLTSMPTTPTGGLPAACTTTKAPTIGQDTASEAPPGVNTVMAQLTALALACEQTRVASFMFSLPAAHVYYRHLTSGTNNMNADFHDTICHTDPGSNSAQDAQKRVNTGVLYAMTCLNEFLTNLQSTPHGSGNLLDSTLVYVTSDTAFGKDHNKFEWPVLLAGKAGGRLKGDSHFNFSGENLSRALLTVAKIMGSTKTQIGGGAGVATAALPGIQV